jgi:hypothetical protein
MKKMLNPISESEMRVALLNTLRQVYDPESCMIVEELVIGGRGARVDVALISDNLTAFEIKSDFDNYDRLSNQIHAYNRVFEQISIVVGWENALKVNNVVPSWWGIVVAVRGDGGTVDLIGDRPPQPNPLRDPYSLASLLWREEAIELLTAATMIEGSLRKRDKSWLFDQISETFCLEQIACAVSKQLKQRVGWRGQLSFVPSGDLLHLDARS